MQCVAPSESTIEFVRVEGATHPYKAWVNTPDGTWEKNPYFIGFPVPHPDDWDEINEIYLLDDRELINGPK